MPRSVQRDAGPGDRIGLVLTLLVIAYVPVVAVSLCQVEAPLLLMAVLYAAPLVVALLAWAWMGVRALGRRPRRGGVPRGVPAHG